jgi:hypothetical protein
MEIIGRIGTERQSQLRSHILTLKDIHATPETAKCCRGRKNFWLQAEPNYSTRKYKFAVTDERLWQYIKSLVPESALAQVYFSEGMKGIDWHQDAAYAGSTAWILNLGNIKLQMRDKRNPSVVTHDLELKGGELVKFHCKNPYQHRAIPVDSNRIGIGIWTDAIPLSVSSNWS